MIFRKHSEKFWNPRNPENTFIIPHKETNSEIVFPPYSPHNLSRASSVILHQHHASTPSLPTPTPPFSISQHLPFYTHPPTKSPPKIKHNQNLQINFLFHPKGTLPRQRPALSLYGSHTHKFVRTICLESTWLVSWIRDQLIFLIQFFLVALTNSKVNSWFWLWSSVSLVWI